MEHAIEQAAKVTDGILSADPQVAREMFGDEPDKIARALADAGLLVPDVRWLAENIRNTSKTHGWHSKGDLMRSTLQLVDLILGPDPDPHGPLMIPTPDTDDWDY